MITSRLTTKAQTTVPKAVRAALGLAAGDTLVYDMADGHVVLRRFVPRVVDDPYATFSEWEGEADCAAYAEL